MSKILMALTILSISLAACASVQYASTSQDTLAKSFTPINDKALVYVFRKGYVGYTQAVPVMVDSRFVGATGAASYLVIKISPGDHLISATTPESFSGVDIRAEPGKLYFIHMNVYTGFTCMRASMEKVSEKEGKEAVLKYQLIRTIE
jgi:hypothetical protein